MSAPSEPVPVPEVVAAIAAGRPAVAVWVNELGGVTFRIDGGAEYVKVTPPEWAHHLVDESERLRWAGGYTRVPEVLGAGDGWLHTAGLPANSAVDPRWSMHPRVAVRAIGTGLRLLHDRLPVGDCPFGPPAWVSESMPVDLLVVCHGDACAPNTLVDDDGRFLGHVDLGDLGVADRWADLAVATLSLAWNYAGNWEHELFDAYGVEPDAARIAFYRERWNAADVSSH
ncbi:aminoglycoside 3'-phosphotransferase [Mycolicibacterium moriokaense]|nr:aminoglycoside 3'-phosphotransferase [Mycolicibacterium moriokaense]